jgi:signal transduction histidine kinase
MDAHEARIYTAIIIAGLVLGVIVIYFVISIIRQQKRNLELQRASILAEISVMENERKRIAADLHDDLGPILSVIKFQVDNVNALNEEDKQQLVKTSEQLDILIRQIREIANNLMPSALQRKGLITAAEEFFSKAGEAGDLEIEFTHPENLILPEEKSINIYRAIQEIVHNCTKHAHATKIEVKFERKNSTFSVFCRDNGRGFDYQKMIKESTGIGLKSLKNRIEMMGGTLTVDSKPGKGTIFLFEIPVK